MYNINIDNNTLIAIIVVSIIIATIIIYYIHRKCESFDTYIKTIEKEIKTFHETQEQYKQSLINSGIKSNAPLRTIIQIITEFINKNRGS